MRLRNVALTFVIACVVHAMPWASAQSSAADPPTVAGLAPSLATPSLPAKWAEVVTRFREQEAADFAGFAIDVIDYWNDGVALARGARTLQTLDAVQTHFNQVAYVPDASNYRRIDRWSTPVEFISNGGDCECFAAAKYFALARGGWPREHLYMLTGRLPDGEAHTVAMAAVAEEGVVRWWILDNRVAHPVPVNQTDMVPLIAMNEALAITYGKHRLDDRAMELPPPARAGDPEERR